MIQQPLEPKRSYKKKKKMKNEKRKKKSRGSNNVRGKRWKKESEIV